MCDPKQPRSLSLAKINCMSNQITKFYHPKQFQTHTQNLSLFYICTKSWNLIIRKFYLIFFLWSCIKSDEKATWFMFKLYSAIKNFYNFIWKKNWSFRLENGWLWVTLKFLLFHFIVLNRFQQREHRLQQLNACETYHNDCSFNCASNAFKNPTRQSSLNFTLSENTKSIESTPIVAAISKNMTNIQVLNRKNLHHKSSQPQHPHPWW